MPTIGEQWLFTDTVTFTKAPSFLAGSADDAYARSKLIEDALAEYALNLAAMQVTGTGALLGAVAGTPAGAFGLTIGTHGSATPILSGEAASNNSKTNKLRFQFTLPPEYCTTSIAGAQGAIHIRVRAKVGGTLAVAQTLDLTCFLGDEAGGVGTDLCTTTIKTLTTSYVDYAFILDPAGLAVGDVLDFEITGVANDTGGTANKTIDIGKISVLLDVKG